MEANEDNAKELPDELIEEHEELLLRILAHGHADAQSWVLALYANASSDEPRERAIRALEQMQEGGGPSP